MKTCPQCEKTYPDSEQFCAADGTALVAVGAAAATRAVAGSGGRECPVCGGKAEPGEAICNFCGARLDPQAAEPSPPPPARDAGTRRTFDDEPPEASTSGGRRVLVGVGYAVAALVALAAGAWLAIRLSSPAPKVTAEATPTAAPSPAESAALVSLADKLAVQVTGESAAAPERDQTAARKVFVDNQPGLVETYKRALAADSATRDGVVVRLRVTPAGDVAAGSVRVSTAPNPSLDQEAVKAMMGWKFVAFGGSEVEVDYPVIFARNAAEQAVVESSLSDKLAHLDPAEPPEYAFALSTPTPAAVALATPAPLETPPPPAKVERPRRLASRPPPKPTLLELVRDKLRTDRRFSRVKAYTDQGVVTLFGKVYDDDAKAAAERAVHRIDGVTSVINTVNTDTAEWAANESRINEQLHNAGLGKVSVKVIGHDAYLSGEVSTDLEKQRAVTIAEGAAAVAVRTNLIRVVPGSFFGF